MEDSSKIGEEMYGLIKDLFPICRSITGNGTRETLKIISELISIDVHEGGEIWRNPCSKGRHRGGHDENSVPQDRQETGVGMVL